jgi:short-chain fatty acids transporter
MEERRLVLPAVTGVLFLLLVAYLIILIGSFYGLGLGKLMHIWGRGLFSLLEFSMLSILLWMSVMTIVQSPPVGRIIRRLSASVGANGSAGLLIAFSAAILGWFNWIFGLCFALYLAREVARENLGRGIRLHYPYLLSCAYMASATGLLGLFSPIQLYLGDKIAHIGPIKSLIPISISESVFSPTSLVISVVLIIVLPISLYIMRPRGRDNVSVIPEEELAQPRADSILYYKVKPREEQVPADKIETSVALTLVVSILGFISILYHLLYKGDPLTFRNAVFLLFMIGLLVNKTPVEFAYKVRETAKTSSYVPILVILAAGLAVIMVKTGVSEHLSSAISGLGAFTPILFFICAFVLGLVLPDPSTVWVVFGPLVSGATSGSTHSVILSVIALICGFQLSRFLQPYYHFGILGVSDMVPYEEMKRYLRVNIAIAFVVYIVVIAISTS